MILSKRKQAILNVLKEKRTISVQELIQQFNVASVTIRRDLSALEESSLIKRTHGEVHLLEDNTIPTFSVRSTTNIDLKGAIAARAAEMVVPGMTILLDSGTSTLEIAKRIVDKPVTLVTNSLDITYTLANSEVSVISCGGMLMSNHMCFLGPDAEQFISKIEVDLLFLGATGVRGIKGLTTSSALQYNIKKAMIRAAKRTYAVFDQSKIGSANIYVFADFSEINGIITNCPEEGSEAYHLLEHLKETGLDVVFVNPNDYGDAFSDIPGV